MLWWAIGLGAAGMLALVILAIRLTVRRAVKMASGDSPRAAFAREWSGVSPDDGFASLPEGARTLAARLPEDWPQLRHQAVQQLAGLFYALSQKQTAQPHTDAHWQQLVGQQLQNCCGKVFLQPVVRRVTLLELQPLADNSIQLTVAVWAAWKVQSAGDGGKLRTRRSSGCWKLQKVYAPTPAGGYARGIWHAFAPVDPTAV